jgi:NTP pyrophosphatase (non-canonical NTP hydrolase)
MSGSACKDITNSRTRPESGPCQVMNPDPEEKNKTVNYTEHGEKMDKEQFEYSMEHDHPDEKSYDEKFINDTIRRSIDMMVDDGQSKGTHNLIIAMEELAELSQQIAKHIRGKSDHDSLLEELADARLSIRYVQEICGIDDAELRRAEMVKIDRLKNNLDSDEHYR